jgi:toxin ParE1/3/4
MREILVRPQAADDLREIWNYIAGDNLAAANRILDELISATDGLAATPGKGHSRAGVKIPDLWFWAVHPYVIAYRYDDKTLTVVRVVHGRRNFRRLFKR